MQSKESELRQELAVLRARVAQLEAQAPDPSGKRLITQNSLIYLVKCAAKPSDHPVSGVAIVVAVVAVVGWWPWWSW